MLNLIPDDHWSEIDRLITPHCVGHISLAVVGGSQVLKQSNGKPLVTQNSDTDLLIISPYVRFPTSITAHIKGQRYDLILRDIPSLLWDFENDRAQGRGTLLHLFVFGQQVRGDPELHQNIRNIAQTQYTQGPAPIQTQDVDEIVKSLYWSVEQNKNQNLDHSLLAGLHIAHQLMFYTLRVAGVWAGKGKMAPRLLEQAGYQQYQTQIECGYESFLAGNPHSFQQYIQNTLPYIHKKAPEHAVPLWIPGQSLEISSGNHKVDLAAAFTMARTRPENMRDYLSNPSNISKKAAAMWLQWKTHAASGAVTPDRQGRPNNEYFYAVGKLLGVMLTLNDLNDPAPIQGGKPLAERLASLQANQPYVAENVRKALAGDPDDLAHMAHTMLDNTLNIHVPPDIRPSPDAPRPTPNIFRKSGSLNYSLGL